MKAQEEVIKPKKDPYEPSDPNVKDLGSSLMGLSLRQKIAVTMLTKL